jgi:hypothetical protein
MEVRSMEENTTDADEHEHSSNNKCEDSGMTKTTLTLDKNSRKWNGEKRQEEADTAEFHAIWVISETVDGVIMIAEGLNMRQYDEIIYYQSAIVNLTKCLLGNIIYKGGLIKKQK